MKIHWMPIIYLTAHSEPQVFQRAKDTSPAAYLLKPFRHNELAFQVELAYLNQYNNRHPTNLLGSEKLYLPINKGHEKVAKQDVLYLLAEGAYVKVYMVGEEKPHLLAMNLGYLAQYFSTANFHRLSRSLLINLDHVSRLERSQLFMHKQPVPISIPEGNRVDLIKKLAVVRTR
ncbi:LytR/AlgR family response regulator transcription factor [Spirosoma flavum]|uniref:LytR/AlgR family response regulator transcription factor n=1 Tax=Spirosoma flavum TaxID=2048557 RepID=A0ABW6ALY7_9BACT